MQVSIHGLLRALTDAALMAQNMQGFNPRALTSPDGVTENGKSNLQGFNPRALTSPDLPVTPCADALPCFNPRALTSPDDFLSL